MDNKQVIEKVIAAFENNDVDGIMELMTDDIEWNMVGDRIARGKEEMRTMFPPDIKMTSSTSHHIIIQGDHAAVDGEATCVGKNGTMNMSYADIYELEKGKVKKMVSYIVDKKS